MQEITAELIEKFFNGQCSREEAIRVWEYLKNNPDNDYLLGEWEHTDGTTPLPSGYSAEMLNTIIENHADKPHSWFRLLKMTVAVAAGVLAIWGTWQIWGSHPVPAQQPVLAQQAVESIWQAQYNQQSKDTTLHMPDGSIISLSPGSSVRYRKDFGRYGKREIILSGRAVFAVATNRQQPFRVYSEGLTTTVLGTKFLVTAFKTASNITVRLYEGRVLVATDSLQHKTNTTDFYLQPGEELVFDKLKKQASKTSYLKKPKQPETDSVPQHGGHAEAISNWYMFDNQRLADVFEQLSVIYNVKIEYTGSEICQMSFIGKIEKTDSLDKILKDIALLNNLQVSHKNGGYLIKKRKH